MKKNKIEPNQYGIDSARRVLKEERNQAQRAISLLKTAVNSGKITLFSPAEIKARLEYHQYIVSFCQRMLNYRFKPPRKQKRGV